MLVVKLRTLLLLMLAVLGAFFADAQTVAVKGKILDEEGKPIIGASIKIKGRNLGTTTKDDGSFSLNVKEKTVLVISAIGYKVQEAEASSDLQVKLLKSVDALDEVVVTALGVKREKRNLTFSSQELKGDELVKSKEPSVLNAITGKVAGVQVTSASGTPGSSSRIIVRGTTSLYGENQALIVLDGVPIDNSETGSTPNGGSGNSRLSDIDPSIIENINVLKGAAATALYGSAGARGVVLITTKKGTGNKKPTVTFSSSTSLEKAILPERQYKYAQGESGVYYDGEDNKTSSSWGPLMDTLYINGVKAKAYNPLKDFFKTGVSTNNTLSVAGGTPQSGYFLSYSYFDQSGTIPKDTYKRHSFFAKFNSQILDNLTATFQMNYSNVNNNKLPDGYGLESPLWTIFTAPVSYDLKPVYNSDGSQRLFRYSRNNPYWVVDNVLNTSTVNRFIPVMNFNYTPTKWLTVTERIGADIYSERQNYHVNTGDVTYTQGYLYNGNTNFRQFNHDLIIQFHHQFGKFNSSLLFGNNLVSNYTEYMTANGQGLAKAGYYNMASASSVTYSESKYQTRKVGFYAQGEVDYDRYLVLSLTGRYDGSSVLSVDKAYYPYGSAALGFIFSEKLPENLRKVINFGKVRASYAVVGNDNVGAYVTTTPYAQASVSGSVVSLPFPYNGNNGFLISTSLGNANLKNELQTEKEVGLEMKFLNSRIGFEASYFDRKMTDGLASGVQLAYSTGFASTTINSAIIQTKGLELLVNATPVKTKNFSWDVTINWTKLNNKVLNIGEGASMVNIGQTYAFVGQPYGVLYGSKYDRTATGQLKIDADGLPYSSSDNEGIVGNVTPDWTGGITNTFRFKQFSAGFFIDVKKGGQLINADDMYGYYYGTSKQTENRQDRVIAGISDVDGKANTVVVTAQNYFRRLNSITEAFVQSAAYVKLRNVNLSYNFKRQTLAHTPFREASITLTGRNLWIHKASDFTGSDPEVNSFGSSNGSMGTYSYSTPTSRSYDCTLKLVF